MDDRRFLPACSKSFLGLAMLASFLGIPRDARATERVADAGVVALPTAIDASQWTSIRVHSGAKGVVWIVSGPGGTCSDLAAATWHDPLDGGADRPDADVLEGSLPDVDPSQADAIAVDEDEDALARTLADWQVTLPDELAARLDEVDAKGGCFVALRFDEDGGGADAAGAEPDAPSPGVVRAAPARGAPEAAYPPGARVLSTQAGPAKLQEDDDGGGGGGGGGAAAAEACGSAAGGAGDSCGSTDDEGDDCSGSSDEGDDCSGSGGGGDDCSGGGAPDDCRLAHDGTRGHRARRSPTSRLLLALASIAFFARRRKRGR
jgi:hypothetical protein